MQDMVQQNSPRVVRTRVGPSPTGYPHIGTIYQALFDYAFAKKNNGKFIVRIEDTDRERFVPDAEERIYEALDWFNLSEDESTRKGGEYAPYVQSERLPLYQKHAKELIEKGHSYYCFCSKERLEELRTRLQKEKKSVMYDQHCRKLSKEEVAKNLADKLPHVVRMKIPHNETIVCNDELRGEVSFDSNTVDDQVILKSDGFPTYHLAAVVDDHLMKISHVVRGEEWLPSFPKHVLLYRYFDWDIPLFVHTPTLRNPDKSKLSKRHGHTNVSWYQEAGYLPEAILNFLALLGWSHPEEKEIFSLSEFIKLFDLKDIKPVGPIFDLTKLTWMNQQYIQNTPDDILKEYILTFSALAREMPEGVLDQLMPIIRTRMETLQDFDALTEVFLNHALPESVTDQEKEVAQNLVKAFSKLEAWETENIFAAMKEILLQYHIRMPVLYVLVTGKPKGLPLPETVAILGKEKTIARLQEVATV